MTATGRNYSDSMRFREGVSMFLMIAGLDGAEPRPARKPSAAIAAAPEADIFGVASTWVETRTRISQNRLGSDLDAARRSADATGTKRAVVIQHRAGRPLSDSLVVMSLHDWADLISPP